MPGYRSGFAAGDPDVIAALKRYRPNVGVAPQEFVQRASIAAWEDEAHVVEVRDRYRAKRDALLPALLAAGFADVGGPATFFLWLRAPAGERRRGVRGAAAGAAASFARPARTSALAAPGTCGSRSCRRSEACARAAARPPALVGVQRLGLSSPHEPRSRQDLDGPGRRCCGGTAGRRRRRAPRALTTSPSGVVTRVPAGDVEAGLDDAVVAQRDPEAAVGAEQAALADRDDARAAARQRAHDRGPAAHVAPSPTTTPGLMRPSTIDAPSVPALKFTKPSCMTVVPAARCAPRRTRSASAIRTPDGHDVVGHARELVDAGDLRAARPAARARSRGRGELGEVAPGRGSSRPRWSARRRCRRG